MKNSPKAGLAIGAAVALIIGLGAAGAIAATNVLSPSEESKAVIDDAASQLGVQPSALESALKQALKNRIDAAVEAGRLTKEQASELKARIDSEDFPLIGPRGHRGSGFPGHGFGRGEGLAAAASYLGMTEAELRTELHDKTLAEIAKEKGKSVSGLVQAMVTAAEKQIDEAVAGGKLTKEQAAAIKADLQARIQSLVDGEFRHDGLGPHPWFGARSESPRGPPPFFAGSPA